MTLEELLKDIENKKACAATDYKECLAREHGCEDCPFDHVGIDLLYPEIIERLEELRDVSKAFMLACEYFEMEDAGLFYERFMQEARENNEDEQKRSQDV